MARRKPYKLTELVAGMNEENRHPEVLVGPPRGREFPNEEATAPEASGAMVERVARALWRQSGRRIPVLGDDEAEMEERCWREHIADARAAIAAMREPTRDMEWAATGRNQTGEETLYGSIYRAMIDAALSPPA